MSLSSPDMNANVNNINTVVQRSAINGDSCRLTDIAKRKINEKTDDSEVVKRLKTEVNAEINSLKTVANTNMKTIEPEAFKAAKQIQDAADEGVKKIGTEAATRIKLIASETETASKQKEECADKDIDISKVITEVNVLTLKTDEALITEESTTPNKEDNKFEERNLQYVTGKTWGKTRITRNSNKVQKFGCMSGITHGEVKFNGLSVKKVEFKAKGLLEVADPLFFNQYEIVNTEKDVCQLGDSGGLVFTKDYAGDLICIGMVTGVLDDTDNNYPLHGVVTPITDILRELKVQNLKPFKDELTVAHLEKKFSENFKKNGKNGRNSNQSYDG